MLIEMALHHVHVDLGVCGYMLDMRFLCATFGCTGWRTTFATIAGGRAGAGWLLEMGSEYSEYKCLELHATWDSAHNRTAI